MKKIFESLKKQYKKAANLGLQACAFFTIIIAANQISDETPSTNVAASSVVFLTFMPLLSPIFTWFTDSYENEEDKYSTYWEGAIKECQSIIPLQIQNAVFIGVWFLFLKLHDVGKITDVDLQNATILLESSATFLFFVDPLCVKILIRAICFCLNEPWKDFFRIQTDVRLNTPCQKIMRDYLQSFKLAVYITAFASGLYGSNKLIEKENFVPKEHQHLTSMLITAATFLTFKPLIDTGGSVIMDKLQRKKLCTFLTDEDDDVTIKRKRYSSDTNQTEKIIRPNESMIYNHFA